MAVYKRDIVDINLETGNIHRSFLKHSIGYMDQKADHFGVRIFRNGEPVNLTGVSVQGVFMPPQGSPIAITTGNIVSDNVAEVVLPQACYNYDGQFTLAIKLVDSTNEVTGTVRIVDGMVDNTHASGTVAPTSAVPTYQEVLSAYEQAIAVIGNSVRFDQSQSLTDTQKGTARTNIAAASESELSDVKSALLQVMDRNAYNAILKTDSCSNNGNGITYTKNGNNITANGTASANAYYVFFNETNNLFGLEVGKTYDCIYATTDNSIVLQPYYYKSGGGFGALSIVNNKVTIPSNAIGLWFRVLIASGTTVTNAVFSLDIPIGDTNVELTNSVVELTNSVSEINSKDIDFRNEINDLQSRNEYNIVLKSVGKSTTPNGITYTANGNVITASGTASGGNSYYTFLNATGSLVGMELGKKYACEYQTTNNNIELQMYYYKSGGSLAELTVINNTITIPSNAVGILARARIASGTQISTAATFSLSIYSLDKTNANLFTENIIQNGLYDLTQVWEMEGYTATTGSGITYTRQSDWSFKVNGTADANQNSYYYFYNKKAELHGLNANGIYSAVFNTTDSNIQLQMFFYYSENNYRQVDITDGRYVKVPSDAIGAFLRIYIPAGTTVNNATVNFRFYSTVTPKDLYENISNESTLPKYWTDYLEGKAPDLFEADESVGFNGVSFAFITDLHWLFNQKKSPALLKWIKEHTSINMIVQGGDILSNYTYHGKDPDEAYREYVSMTKGLNFINVFGNHDLDTSSAESEIYTKADFYAICQRTTESIVNWEPGTLCGYCDNKVQKTRLIFWDYSLRTYTKLQDWITELESGWSVIIFTHYIWHLATDAAPDATYGQPMIDAVDAVYDNADCTIIGIICGHLHADKNTTSVKGYPIIGTTCDASTGSQADYDPVNPTRTPGTTLEQAFDLYYINKTNKTINTIRIGAGDTSSDRSFTYP